MRQCKYCRIRLICKRSVIINIAIISLYIKVNPTFMIIITPQTGHLPLKPLYNVTCLRSIITIVISQLNINTINSINNNIIIIILQYTISPSLSITPHHINTNILYCLLL